MTNKFTPRPWFTHREGLSTVYVEARIGGGLIQEVAACGPTAAGHEQQEANARPIAAAPKMLEALHDCREALRRAGASGELAVVDSAIAIAQGTA